MKADFLRAKYFLYCLLHRSGYQHGDYLRKHNAFHSMGRDCFFQPYNLPADAKYIRIGDNVVIAPNVHFICHDGIHFMINHISESSGGATAYWGIIDIGDNVFIGSNTTILANVTVGSNVIIAAGSLLNKNVPDGKIVGGVPARVIGETADLIEIRKQYSEDELGHLRGAERLRFLWDRKGNF